ncbi:MAG TPA: VOC family protein [Candidatus Baltobacteraceae bacterium]|nr:VOC family protein [Candidatus Baltobacteraceae bacterium]
MVSFLFAVLVAAAPAPAPPPSVASVEIVVGDLAAERRFYTGALDFTDLGTHPFRGGRVDRLSLGREHVDLISYDAPGAAIPLTARSDDRNFQHVAIIVSDMQRAWSQVQRFRIRKVSSVPQVLPAWNPAAGGIAAVYFRDPEGHPLELLHFPPGKGAPQWQAAAPLFLGIDHTAIAITDTAASTRFYEALGFSVRGHSDNYGIEQEALSAIPRAHVHITAVRFSGAPGVEFLEYVTPLRSQPRETAQPNDLLAARTRLIESNAAALCATLAPVARRPAGCLVRDPDGHFIEIESPPTGSMIQTSPQPGTTRSL